MSAIETLFIDGINTIFGPTLDGVVDAVNVSADVLGRIYGEQFLQDLVNQLEHINLDFIDDIEKLRLEAINFNTELTIGLENLSLELDEIKLDLSIDGLSAIQPPSIGAIKWIESISTYIYIFCAIIVTIILVDAYNINKVTNDFQTKTSSRYTYFDRVNTLKRV